MVDGQIRAFDVTDRPVIDAFLEVAREAFMPDDLRDLAYSDAALTLRPSGAAAARTLLRPMHLARLLQGAGLQPAHRALVVAGETGYAACLLAELVASVVTLESDPEFTALAARNGAAHGRGKVEAVSGPLTRGHAGGAPYDVILVQGAVEIHIEALFEQLAIGGRLVTVELRPSGASPGPGRAMRFDRVPSEVSRRVLFDATAPLLAEFRRPAAFAF